RATAERPALLEDRRSARTVDRAVDAAPAEQRGVGRVDDRVDALARDVAPDGLDHETFLIGRCGCRVEGDSTNVRPRRARCPQRAKPPPEAGSAGREAAAVRGVSSLAPAA